MGSPKKITTPHNRHYFKIETDKDVTGYRNIQSARKSAILMLSKKKYVTVRKVNGTPYGLVRRTNNGYIWMQYKDGKLTDSVILNPDGTTQSKRRKK